MHILRAYAIHSLCRPICMSWWYTSSFINFSSSAVLYCCLVAVIATRTLFMRFPATPLTMTNSPERMTVTTIRRRAGLISSGSLLRNALKLLLVWKFSLKMFRLTSIGSPQVLWSPKVTFVYMFWTATQEALVWSSGLGLNARCSRPLQCTALTMLSVHVYRLV